MSYWWLYIRAHFLAQYSTPANFWSGVLGMIINNVLVLLGLWAMLFANREGVGEEQDYFLTVNFLIMLAFGVLHALLGGLGDLAAQINEGQLDLVLVQPRDALIQLALSRSEITAWGDIFLGLLGLGVLSWQKGWLFCFHVSLMACCALAAFVFLHVLIGALAFWLRRTEIISNVAINVIMGLNFYPVFDRFRGWKYVMFFLPMTMVGVIPTHFILHPNVNLIFIELASLMLFAILAKLVFRWGLRHYQSTPMFTSTR